MNVKVEVKEWREVVLDQSECKKVAIEFIKEIFKLPGDVYIKNGKLVYNSIYSAGFHEGSEEIIVRDATEEDKLLVDVIYKIRAFNKT